MNKFKKAVSIAMLATMVVGVPVTAYAAPTEQTSVVKYRSLTRSEKNLLSSFFDAEYYAEANPDVVKAYGNKKSRLFDHFVRYGVFEGRSANEEFNPGVYKACYADLENAFGDNIISYYGHYASFGKNENRELTTVEKAAEAGITLEGSAGSYIQVSAPAKITAAAPASTPTAAPATTPATTPSTTPESSQTTAPTQTPAQTPEQAPEQTNEYPVIITTFRTAYVCEDTVIKNSPDENAEVVGVLHAGDEVSIGERVNSVGDHYNGGYQYYLLEDGRYVRDEMYSVGGYTSNTIEYYPMGTVYSWIGVQDNYTHYGTGASENNSIEDAILEATGTTLDTILSDWVNDNTYACDGEVGYVNPANGGHLYINTVTNKPVTYFTAPGIYDVTFYCFNYHVSK